MRYIRIQAELLNAKGKYIGAADIEVPDSTSLKKLKKLLIADSCAFSNDTIYDRRCTGVKYVFIKSKTSL